MRALGAVALAVLLLGGVAPAPADDPQVPERYIKVDEAKAFADQNGWVTFIDVRPAAQFADLHIRGAINIPLDDLRARLADVPRNLPVVLY
ncbi:MAG TPA: rhodanese-like domain-containing protein [Candidatus Methylomirabilis sp.]|nr:rhodanese-like domain-containing protein [Candidatus Methylomirabilis sp.]